MPSFSTGLVIISAVALFFLAFFKLCILGKKLDSYALLLIIFGACTIGGDMVVPTVLNKNWDLMGQASLMFGAFLWILIDMWRNGSSYDRK